MTRLLRARDIAALLGDMEMVFAATREGFLASREGLPAERRAYTALPGPGTAAALFPGLLPGVPAYTVKVNSKFPRARPAIRGVVCRQALEDGELLALLDSASVTSLRTGVAAALITDRLAPREAVVLGVVGAGTQASMTVRALAKLRRLERLVVHDIDEAACGRLLRLGEQLGIAVEAAGSVGEVAAVAAVLLLATWSCEPLLALADVRAGQHITMLGADEPGKCELAADLLAAATLVVDDRELVQAGGATASAGLGPEHVAATASDVLAGAHPGRSRSEELTVYAPIGMPWQDLALAWPLYREAVKRDAGLAIDLLE